MWRLPITGKPRGPGSCCVRWSCLLCFLRRRKMKERIKVKVERSTREIVGVRNIVGYVIKGK